MSRTKGLTPPIDTRAGWQIDQAAKCGCEGADDMCRCQNSEEPWLYGLGGSPPSWDDHEDDIADAIQDSIDMDWNSSIGARAVVAWLKKNGFKI